MTRRQEGVCVIEVLEKIPQYTAHNNSAGRVESRDPPNLCLLSSMGTRLMKRTLSPQLVEQKQCLVGRGC